MATSLGFSTPYPGVFSNGIVIKVTIIPRGLFGAQAMGYLSGKAAF